MDILDRKFRFLYKNHKTLILLIFYSKPSLSRLRTAPVCSLPDHHSPSFRTRLVLLSCIFSSDGSAPLAPRPAPSLIPPLPCSSLPHFVFGQLCSACHSRLVLSHSLRPYSCRAPAQSSEILLPPSPCRPAFASSARFSPPRAEI